MNTRLIHLAVVAAITAGRLCGQAPAAPAAPGAPLAPTAITFPATTVAPATPASSATAGTAFPAFPEPPSRLRKATNAAAPAPAVSTNFPSALPRAFPRPASPAPSAPIGASSAAGGSKAGSAGAGKSAAKPGAAAAGQPSEEDQAMNDATLKALRESRGTNQPGDSIVFKDQDLNVFLDQVYGPLVKRTVLRAQGLPQVKISIDTQTTLTESEEVQMWDTVLALNGITMIPQGEKFVTAVPVAQALQEGAKFSDKPADQYAEASQFVTHVVQLKHVAIEEA
ncbi:MAG: hypothetical protein NT050_05810, partial [Verrucomicrobia bacterium]|nr:hypothetical protein [Verrucomicrobiota bacterium]